MLHSNPFAVFWLSNPYFLLASAHLYFLNLFSIITAKTVAVVLFDEGNQESTLKRTSYKTMATFGTLSILWIMRLSGHLPHPPPPPSMKRKFAHLRQIRLNQGLPTLQFPKMCGSSLESPPQCFPRNASFFPIAHDHYIKILTWLRGFLVILCIWFGFLCHWALKSLPGIERQWILEKLQFWPYHGSAALLGVILEFKHIERGLINGNQRFLYSRHRDTAEISDTKGLCF